MWGAHTSGEKSLLTSFPDFSSGMAALAVLLLPELGAGTSSSCLTFVCPLKNHIPEGMASSEIKNPRASFSGAVGKLCWLQAGGFSKVWTTAEGEGWGSRGDLCRGWSRAQEGRGNLEGITPKAEMPGWELQGDPSKEQTERGHGSAGKEEHKSLGKNLWNDLEKILQPQRVRNVPSAGIGD